MLLPESHEKVRPFPAAPTVQRSKMNLQNLDFLRASPARIAASRLVERLGLASKSIDAQQLIDLATTRAGRRDLGDTELSDSLYGNLEQLLVAIDHGAK